MDDEEMSESDDDSQEGGEQSRNAPTPLFGSEDGSAERAMDSLDQMSVDDLLRLKREFIKADTDNSGELDMEEFCETVTFIWLLFCVQQ